MSEIEQQLLGVLSSLSFRKGDFTLVSGAKSNYYIDGKMSEVNPKGAYLIGEVLFNRIRQLGVDAIGGLAVGAVPLVTATVISSHHHRQPIEGFWVRDEVKSHGTKKLIEGGLKPGSRVVIVDDVITKGGSSLKAVNAVRESGCEVVLVLALVDRLAGARELFAENGITNFEAVFTIREFGVEVPDNSSAVAN
jgi:orotate phosphoribosyltransferase